MPETAVPKIVPTWPPPKTKEPSFPRSFSGTHVARRAKTKLKTLVEI